MTPISPSDVRISFIRTLDVPKELLTSESELFKNLITPPEGYLPAESSEINVREVSLETFQTMTQLLKSPEGINASNAEEIYRASDIYGFEKLKDRVKAYVSSLDAQTLEKYVINENPELKLFSTHLLRIASTLSFETLADNIHKTALPKIKEIFSSIFLTQLLRQDPLIEPLSDSSLDPLELINSRCEKFSTNPDQLLFSKLDTLEKNHLRTFLTLCLMIDKGVDLSNFFKEAKEKLSPDQYSLLWNILLIGFENALQKIVQAAHHGDAIPINPLINYMMIGSLNVKTISRLENLSKKLSETALANGRADIGNPFYKLIKQYPLTLSENHYTTLSEYKNFCAARIVEMSGRVCFLASLAISGLAIGFIQPTRDYFIRLSFCWLVLSPATMVAAVGATVGLFGLAVIIRTLGGEILRTNQFEGAGFIILFLANLGCAYYVLVLNVSNHLESWGIGTLAIRKFSRILAPSLAKYLSVKA